MEQQGRGGALVAVAPGPGEDLKGGTRGRRKIRISYIEDKGRRQITFSKRKAGLMKKAYELTTLTGTQALLLVASETGHVYTFATPKLQPFVTLPEGKNLIQSCLNASDPTAISESAYPDVRLETAAARPQQEFPGLYPQGTSHVQGGHMLQRPQLQHMHHQGIVDGSHLDDGDDLDQHSDSAEAASWSTAKEGLYGYSS